eukprot:CFRG4575T1
MKKEKDGHLLIEFEPGKSLPSSRVMDLGSTTMVTEFLTKEEWLAMREAQVLYNKVLSCALKKDMVEELRELSNTLNKTDKVKSVTFRVDHTKKILFGKKENVRIIASVSKPTPQSLAKSRPQPPAVALKQPSGSLTSDGESLNTASPRGKNPINSKTPSSEQIRSDSKEHTYNPDDSSEYVNYDPKSIPKVTQDQAHKQSTVLRAPSEPVFDDEDDGGYQNFPVGVASQISNHGLPAGRSGSDVVDDGVYQNCNISDNRQSKSKSATSTSRKSNTNMNVKESHTDHIYQNAPGISPSGLGSSNAPGNYENMPSVGQSESYMNMPRDHSSTVDDNLNNGVIDGSYKNGVTLAPQTSEVEEDHDAYMSFPEEMRQAVADVTLSHSSVDRNQAETQPQPSYSSEPSREPEKDEDDYLSYGDAKAIITPKSSRPVGKQLESPQQPQSDYMNMDPKDQHRMQTQSSSTPEHITPSAPSSALEPGPTPHRDNDSSEDEEKYMSYGPAQAQAQTMTYLPNGTSPTYAPSTIGNVQSPSQRPAQTPPKSLRYQAEPSSPIMNAHEPDSHVTCLSKPKPVAKPRPIAAPRPVSIAGMSGKGDYASNVGRTSRPDDARVRDSLSANPRPRPPTQAPAQVAFKLDGPTLEQSSCFHGFTAGTSRAERRRAIEAVMDGKETGEWLVRHDSSGLRFVLVVRYDARTLHIPMDQVTDSERDVFTIDRDKEFVGMETLLAYYHTHELSKAISTRLTKFVQNNSAQEDPNGEMNGYFMMSPAQF